MIPAGAVIGAASAPTDEEWAETVAYYRRAAATVGRLSAIVDGIDKDGALEKLIARRFDAVASLAGTCVRTRRQGAGCPVSAATPKLKMQLENRTTPYRFEEGGFLTGKKKRTVERYIVSAMVNVQLDMPQPQEDRCYRFSFGSWFTPQDLAGPIARSDVAPVLTEELRQVAALLVLTLFELPGVKGKDRIALLEDRQKELGREFPIIPQRAGKCA